MLAKKSKDGETLIKNYDPLDEKLTFEEGELDFTLSKAELDKYHEIQT